MSHVQLRHKFSGIGRNKEAGFAIGPILFVIAILGILALVVAAGFGDFSSAGTTDRITADMTSQANLIRSKINECNIKYGTNLNFDGYPQTPASGLVADVTCDGDPVGEQNIWQGQRATTLPPPTGGFGPWHYINTNSTGLGGTATGGRCIWTAPSSSNPAGNPGIVSGLTKAASKFDNAASCSPNCPREVIYDPASVSQKFIMWITLPAGGPPDSNCLP
jgi:hypothetical protein